MTTCSTGGDVDDRPRQCPDAATRRRSVEPSASASPRPPRCNWHRLLLLVAASSLASGPACHAFNAKQVTELVHSWAPLVWLHGEEQFAPSSVDFFLRHVTLQNRKGRVIDGQPAPETLPSGAETEPLNLQTREKLGCPTCLGPAFFYGQSVAQGGVPVYAIVRQYQDAWNTIDIVYHTFYPYNRGKHVCIGIMSKEKCLGNYETFGNHVGDWEHATLRFQNGKPLLLYLSSHNFGAYYAWNDTGYRFDLVRGESPKQKAARQGRKMGRRFARDLSPTFPESVLMAGTHPVVYSANGSHGLWAAPGKHTYSSFPLLEDFAEAGTPWNTWENLVIVPWNDTPFPYTGSLAWLNYRGSWGNWKDGCDFESLSGECRLNRGPTFPEGPDDMAPPHIQRTRYLPYPAPQASSYGPPPPPPPPPPPVYPQAGGYAPQAVGYPQAKRSYQPQVYYPPAAYRWSGRPASPTAG